VKRRTVGILVFDDVEVLDFAGPFEVFSRTRLTPGVESRRSSDSAPFDVFTVGQSGAPIRAVGGLVVTPAYSFSSVPAPDIVLVPGGFGTRALLEHRETLDWIASVSESAETVTSVCTGALLLARCGLLAGRKATTHWAALDLLTKVDPTIDVQRDARFIDDGVVTSAGVAAGIDMAFHLVATLCGPTVAEETAAYIEYPYAR